MIDLPYRGHERSARTMTSRKSSTKRRSARSFRPTIRPPRKVTLGISRKSPRIVQQGLNEAIILSVVSTGLGVRWVLGAQGAVPSNVAILPVVDLTMPLMLALAWRRDNTSPVLANFIGEVQGVHTIGSRLATVFFTCSRGRLAPSRRALFLGSYSDCRRSTGGGSH
jgi:DNA-binding transcriptional LysR family regulator